MKIFKIYIDTSVFGGVFDQEFSEYSLLLFNKFRKNEYLPVLREGYNLLEIRTPREVISDER